MAWKLFDIKCTECGETRETLLEDGKIEESCPKCGALSEKQELILGTPKYYRHSSWAV